MLLSTFARARSSELLKFCFIALSENYPNQCTARKRCVRSRNVSAVPEVPGGAVTLWMEMYPAKVAAGIPMEALPNPAPEPYPQA